MRSAGLVFAAFAIGCIACGPAVDVSSGTTTEATADATGDASTTAPDTSPATTTGAATGTSGTTGDTGPSGYEDDDGGTGCTFTCPSPPPSTSGGGGGGVDFECDIWVQDCPEGQKCMPWANDGGNVHNATRCAPLDPNPYQVGEPCQVEGSSVSGVDNCDVYAWCGYVDPKTNEGVCVELCQGSEANPVCTTSGAACILLHGFLPLCTPPCDPLVDVCWTGAGCYPTGSSFACLPSTADPAAAGQPCTVANTCAAGLYCVDAAVLPSCDGDRCCTDYCDVTGPGGGAQCQVPGTECTLLVPDPPEPVWQNLGACLSP